MRRGRSSTASRSSAGVAMGKRSVVSLWFVSALWGLCAVSTGCAAETPRLNQDHLEQPDAVAAWLKENASKANLTVAKGFYDRGLQAKQRRDWGAAAKSFGESAIHYPTPKALNEYEDNMLRMLGSIRKRERTYEERLQGDLSRAEAGYRAALAADVVLNQLTDQERAQAGKNVECLAEYLKTHSKQSDCLPLQLYGAGQLPK